MTVYEIRSNIIYNENLIEQFTNEKQDLENQICELEMLGAKYSGLQSEFGDRQQQRRNKLSLFLASGLQNKIVQRYYNGMNGFLGNADFNNAYDGLSEAKRIINQKISQLDQQLDDCEGRISYRRNRRDYWRSQLSVALLEGAE